MVKTYNAFKNPLFLFLGLAVMIFLCQGQAWAVDPDRLFPQRTDAEFFAQLTANPDSERAVFLGYQGREIVVYLRFSDDKFVLRGQFDPEFQDVLTEAFVGCENIVFSPLKKNGEPLYSKGVALKTNLKASLDNAKTAFAEALYVPFYVNARENDCFVCDAGFLQVTFNADQNMAVALRNAVRVLFGGMARISPKVKLNRYYLYSEDYWGPVQQIEFGAADELLMGPVHKATLNKGISDHDIKANKDKKLVIKLISHFKQLLSQDLRLKLGLVPGFVRLNMAKIHNTDIGSGQNQMIFLSLGPGINYFDDPWVHPPRNLPCPRLIFHRDLAAFASVQVFPTYSIEPDADGEGRLHAINNFQTHYDGVAADRVAKIRWISQKGRQRFFQQMEDALCRYGLINDSHELKPGFSFAGQDFRGNLVNNELRIFQALSVRDLLTAAIIPAGMRDSYRLHYRQRMKDARPHWQYNCGIHFEDLFVEALVSNDKGFRIAWLMLVLRESHPVLFRILKYSQANSKTSVALKLAEKIAAMAASEGRDFFLTDYQRHFKKLDRQRHDLWLDYLEAWREKDFARARVLLAHYEKFYEWMVATCDY